MKTVVEQDEWKEWLGQRQTKRFLEDLEEDKNAFYEEMEIALVSGETHRAAVVAGMVHGFRLVNIKMGDYIGEKGEEDGSG